LAKTTEKYPSVKGVAITIRDVAKHANVSLTTVSHTLSGHGRVSSETRARVLNSVKELGYVASPQAKGLKTGQSMTFLALLPVSESGDSGLHSAFISDVLIGAADMAIEKGYFLTVAGQSSFSQRPVAPSLRFDGLFLIDPAEDFDLTSTFGSIKVPIVSIGRLPRQSTPVVVVNNDYFDGMEKILDHFKGEGYKNIALLSADMSASFAVDSRKAYLSWIEKHSNTNPLIQFCGDYPTLENGRQATYNLLTNNHDVDAIVATTEPLAIGAFNAIQEIGKKLPVDVGLVSMTDSGRLESALTPISALDLRAREIGETVIQTLLKKLRGDERVGDQVSVASDLLVRASSRRHHVLTS
jgi:DNA-binding LacI/PurR family transcriptional regulator